MGNECDNRTIWQRRAAAVGFSIWKGRKLSEMSDDDIRAAFDYLGRRCGIHYIWRQ